MSTNTVLTVTNTLDKVTLTKSYRKIDHIVKKRPNVINSQPVVGVWFGNQVYTRLIKHMQKRYNTILLTRQNRFRNGFFTK